MGAPRLVLPGPAQGPARRDPRRPTRAAAPIEPFPKRFAILCERGHEGPISKAQALAAARETFGAAPQGKDPTPPPAHVGPGRGKKNAGSGATPVLKVRDCRGEHGGAGDSGHHDMVTPEHVRALQRVARAASISRRSCASRRARGEVFSEPKEGTPGTSPGRVRSYRCAVP
jgi:hypothetical protein